MRRVVVTGLGIVSSLGNTAEEVAVGLREGRSGIALIPARQEMGFRCPLSGVIEPPPTDGIPKRNLRQMGQHSYIAAPTAARAIADSGLEEDQVRSDRTGIIIANTGNSRDIYEQCTQFYNKTRKLAGTSVQRAMGSSVSGNLSVWLGTRGYALTVSAACSSGSSAIGYAYQLIRGGVQDRILCGGVEEMCWEDVCGFDASRAFSTRIDDPQGASRPFDRGRDGLVPSAGCGLVILEEYELARHRDARVYAEVVGYGMTSNGDDMTVPSRVGAVRCMRHALTEAGVSPDSVDYVNAHATSTPVGDPIEAQSIAEVLGRGPLVSSTKSMVGHELGTCGSNELVYTLLMMSGRFVAPTINLDDLDPACSCIEIVAHEARDLDINVAISNSLGFGGVNACLVVRRP